MKELKQAIKNVQALAESQMPFIDSRIKDIIRSKSINTQEIESLLDVLLDYQFMGVGEKEFEILNTYYGTFDKCASNDWTRIQKDLLGEE